MRIFDRQVHVDDLVRLLEERVGHRLANRYSGRPLHQVSKALEVLDVHRSDDVHARVEELEDVLVALAVRAARRVRVGNFVDDHDLRRAREDSPQVHLLDGNAPVLLLAPGHDLEAFEQRLRLGATVGVDEPDGDVDTPVAQ